MHSERRRSIIVWGPRGSGKSLYFASLVRWLAREREGLHLAVLPVDDAAARWIASRARQDGAGLILESQPAPTGPHRFRVYSTRNAAGPDRHRSVPLAELTSGDISAGELSAGAARDVTGAMLLLPAKAMASSPELRLAHVAWLAATLARLPEKLGAAPPTVSLPVAVCLTQTDVAPDAERRNAAQWLESFGAETTRALRAHCSRFEVFKVSALGQTPRERDGVEVLATIPEPRGVLAPIRWLLQEMEGEEAA